MSTKWRENRDMNPYKCREGCCRNQFRVCFKKYACKCHEVKQ